MLKFQALRAPKDAPMATSLFRSAPCGTLLSKLGVALNGARIERFFKGSQGIFFNAESMCLSRSASVSSTASTRLQWTLWPSALPSFRAAAHPGSGWPRCRQARTRQTRAAARFRHTGINQQYAGQHTPRCRLGTDQRRGPLLRHRVCRRCHHDPTLALITMIAEL